MPSSTQKMDGLGLELEVDLPKSGGIHEKQYQGRTCNYCLGQGHWKRECPVLKSNSRFYQGVRPEKPVALAVSVRAAGKAGAIAAVKRHTNSMVVAPDLPVVSGLDESDFRSVDPGYCSYVSQGFVSLVGSGKRVRVNILRDSGALDSFILESVLPFSSDSDTGSCVKVRGMGPNVLTVPLHKLSLSSNLVQGEVSLGVCSELPIAGIHVILGNDLARTHVQGGALLIPEGVTRSDTVEPGSGKHTDSAVYPVGVVTRAQSRSGSETEGKDKLRNCSRFPLFDPLLSVTRSELIQEQEEDSSLQEVFHQVRSEGVKIAQAGGAELG
ncbi:uncharacterized protein LOC130513948 [Takifugu flavidus]|nr:uncharacterized protein LOC130513948 [Takifugu flavidus]